MTRFGVVVGEGVVEPRIEGRFARRVGAGMHAHPLLAEPEMAQNALDDILLVDERNDRHFREHFGHRSGSASPFFFLIPSPRLFIAGARGPPQSPPQQPPRR